MKKEFTRDQKAFIFCLRERMGMEREAISKVIHFRNFLRLPTEKSTYNKVCEVLRKEKAPYVFPIKTARSWLDEYYTANNLGGVQNVFF